MKDLDVKIKLWAIQGILTQVNGIEMSDEDALKISAVSLKIYDDIVSGENVFENAVLDAQTILNHLINDVLERE